MLTIKELFRGLYKTCGCGQHNCLIPIVDKDGRMRKYKSGHNNYKSGRYKVRNYWYIYLPNYFSSNQNGTVREHVYFYQEYNKCCMLPWGEVHHKDENTNNNMPWNLQGLTKKQHRSLHFKGKHRDMHNRKCFKCNSTKTYFRKDNKIYTWFKYKKIYWICDSCYRKTKKLDLINSKNK